jgi:hypothetical protein
MGLHNLILLDKEFEQLKATGWPYEDVYNDKNGVHIVKVVIPSEVESKLKLNERRGDLDVSTLW